MSDKVSNVVNDPNKRKWRKKRKNFLSNAKKYSKLGHMGRGTKIPEDLYQYFIGILEAIKQGIEDKDQRLALVQSVLERTKGDELNIIGNQLGCRVVEILLPHAPPEDLERFMEVVSPELRKLCSDNFTSHVVEALLRVSCERATEHLQTEEKQDSDSVEEAPKKKSKLTPKPELKYPQAHITVCYEFTIKICKYALNNLEDFVWDNYANHILRSALKCLSGITLLPGEKPKVNMFVEKVIVDKGIPPHQTKIAYKAVPDEFKEIVKEFANRLSSWPQFKDLPYESLTSALLQVLLHACKNVDKGLTRDLIKKLLNESFLSDDWASKEVADEDDKKDKIVIDDEDDKKDKIVIDDEGNRNSQVSTGKLPPVFNFESAVRLLEACLFVAKKKMYTQIYAKCFINRLSQLAVRPMLNFTVQRLIDNCQIKEEFEPMFDELSDKFGELLASRNSGVLVALARAALRLRARQLHYIKSLESALKCESAEEQKYFSVLVLRLQPLDQVDVSKLDQEYFIHVHGSVILQSILDFQRPAKAVSSLLELTAPELLVIFCDAKGCHVADALCKGQCVGVKARDKLLWKLKGCYKKLALSQYGSRALEQLLQAASSEQRAQLMAELCDKSALLGGSEYGRLLVSKLDLAGFKASPKSWEHRWTERLAADK